MVPASCYILEPMMDEEAFKGLKAQLAEREWPEPYMFKFIFEPNPSTLAKLQLLFDNTARVTIRESTKGKYVSFTAIEMMLDAESVLNRYREAAKIEGLISL